MANPLASLLVASFALWIQPGVVKASPTSGFLNILLCAPSGDLASNATFEALVKRSTAQNQDGPYLFAGPLQSGDFCIKNATFGAAFGVLAVRAELYSKSYSSFLNEVLKRRPQLTEKKDKTYPGLLTFFEDGKYEIQLFNGSAELMVAPDPSSKTVSYMCSQKFSGPQ